MFAKKVEKKSPAKSQELTTAELEKLAGGGCKGCIGRGGLM